MKLALSCLLESINTKSKTSRLDDNGLVSIRRIFIGVRLNFQVIVDPALRVIMLLLVKNMN